MYKLNFPQLIVMRERNRKRERERERERESSIPFNGDRMRTSDRYPIQISKELPKGIKERPVGQKTNTFIGMYSFQNPILFSYVFILKS